ncbi:MAG: peptide MFS transporter [Pseudoxanthomonas sp.]
MSAPGAPATRNTSETLLGHPKGLFYLAFTEAWERFSFYGMQALLVLYMVNQLLLPGHVENIVGFPAFRAAIESLLGPLSTQALASMIFGLYSGLVYFTPLPGGLIGDRWIGQRNAVVMGALLMCGGHLAMAFEQSFLLALLLLVLGSGFLKGNISAQVGALYPVEEEARRTRGFAIFSVGINVGAVAGPLLIGLLAVRYGWHYGFGMAAVFMLGGLFTYLVGYRQLPVRAASRGQAGAGDSLTAAEWRILAALCAVMGITVFQSVSYLQLGNVLPVWLEQHVSLKSGSFSIPAPWYQSIDSFVSILFVPLLFWIWWRQSLRKGEPSDLSKIGTGAWIAAASNLVLVASIVLTGGAPIHWIWPLLYCSGMGVAFLYYWPTLLALVSQAAPAKVNATMLGVAFLSLFIGGILVGWIGGFYESLGPLWFWTLHAAIGAMGGVLVLLFGRRLERVLAGAARQPLRPSSQVLESTA